jgi:HAD domain in Swiss Army Knife RNA repair proteins
MLALDVDGVISLFGFDGPMTDAPGEFHLISGMAHCIDPEVGGRVSRLAEVFDIVWATGWEDRANEALPRILSLPGDLPYLTFEGRARFGTAHWKVDAIDEYAGDRPVAWIDDCLDQTCWEWAGAREAPTLLVPTEPDIGLMDRHVEAMLDWVSEGYTQSREGFRAH